MYFQVNNHKIYYEKHGNNKETIIILPGWGNNRQTFDYLIKKLKNDYTIYIIDYPGFGKSNFPNIDMTIFDYATIIRKFISSNKIDNFNIIAHSFGGRIAIILDSIYKLKINKMIFLDIAGIRKFSIKRLIKKYLYKFLKLLGKALPKKVKTKYQKYLFSKFASTDYNSINTNMYQTFKNIVNTNLKRYVKDISSEVLLIWGIDDEDTPLYIANYLNKYIKESALITLPGHHFIYLEHPYLTTKIITIFLKN